MNRIFKNEGGSGRHEHVITIDGGKTTRMDLVKMLTRVLGHGEDKLVMFKEMLIEQGKGMVDYVNQPATRKDVDMMARVLRKAGVETNIVDKREVHKHGIIITPKTTRRQAVEMLWDAMEKAEFAKPKAETEKEEFFKQAEKIFGGNLLDEFCTAEDVRMINEILRDLGMQGEMEDE